MSAAPTSKETNQKSTTTARVAITSGPAAATIEARKNRKRKMNLTLETELMDPAYTPTAPRPETPIPSEAAHNLNHITTLPIVPYTPSKPCETPPVNMDTFLDEAIPSPFLPPSPTTRNNLPLPPPLTNLTQPDAPKDVPMSNIPTLRAPISAHGPPSSIRARLETAAEHNAISPQTKGTPREPIDKYTRATMPTVHDAHPTAPFDHINIDLITEWENYPGGKLLALPFDTDVQDANQHNEIKDKIFTAIAEIAQSKPQCDLLLKRKVWSSSAITFRITQLNPPCPDFLFTIKGFSTLITEDILDLVRTVWESENITSVMNTISETFPDDARTEVINSINDFLASVQVKYLDYKTIGDILQPHFNVYATGSIIKSDNIWLYLRDYLADCTYATSMQGQGFTNTAPFHCTLCHGVDHPRGLCPFPDITGWNGPKKQRPSNVNRRGRGGRTRGTSTRGRR
ncbi:hypothetical protein F5888DRAFT_1636030 [Russula emetica]|nr:hypothetical protein F5888DRAFT_1636030 [Russula emetica]